MIPGALEHLKGKFELIFKTDARTEATPRRLAVLARNISERNLSATVRGPKTAAGAKAAEGFARKFGVAVADLTTVTSGADEHYGYQQKIDLPKAIAQVILEIPFPKTMYWTGKGGPRFIRPIRWIVALLDDQVIPFEIAGVKSGNESGGHRRLGAAKFPVTFENYERKLRENFVLLSAGERRKRIQAVDLKYKCDPGLLETLVYLTEYPTPITGSFDPEFLTLPKEVLITVMRHHQKYFSVETPDGKLAPQFVAVMNTDADRKGWIRQGNERVLRARFNDARFFWDTDQRKKLADRVQDLANVTFHAKLGTYLEKTGRIQTLVKTMGGDAAAIRAAELSKADLTTELVKEFTELQGIVGGLYAQAQGEPEEVATAIYDHYKPVSMEDSIPRTRAGQLVSLADKLDTLRGCFEAGLMPSGSKDPFALRRAAQGIVKIVVEGKLHVENLWHPAIKEFLLDRVRYYFKDIRGFAYDEIAAVLSSGWEDLVDVEERLIAIQAVRPTQDFEPLAASFKRISNILKQAQFAGDGKQIEPGLLEPGPEADLYQAFEQVRTRAAAQEYRGALETIATLRPKVDLFFDKVLVNAPDATVRQNRLTLLHTLLAEFSTIADFSEIVTNS